MSDPEDPEVARFERRARALLQDSTARLDGHILSRLNQARQLALEQVPATRFAAWGRHAALPVGVAAAAAIAVVAITGWDYQRPQGSAEAVDDLEFIADGEAFELLEDDGSFYEWAVIEETSG